MKDMLKDLDTWIYNLMGCMCLILALISKDTEQTMLAVASSCLFGIQAIIWKLDDCNKNKN